MRGLFVGIIVLLAIILTFSIYMYNLTSDLSEDLSYDLEQLKQQVERENWDETALYLEKLNKNWDRADAWWTPLMDHREIDQIDQTIIRVIGFVHQHRKEDALLEITVAMKMVERVLEMEGVGIKSVF